MVIINVQLAELALAKGQRSPCPRLVYLYDILDLVL